MDANYHRDPRQWIERLFLVTGLAGLVFCLAVKSKSMTAARTASRIVTTTTAGSNPSALPVTGMEAVVSGEGLPAVIGRVEIPALGLATPLLAGDDSMSLSEGAGHIPGTAVPGGLGTVGIAGHRDTHFRRLSHVAVGMEVLLRDQSGTYHYRVTSTEIVTPEQVEVLDIGSRPGLVLITCYPFRYIGAAPKRFVVHADLLSVAADEVK